MNLTQAQIVQITAPIGQRMFLEGPAGVGKPPWAWNGCCT